MNFGKFPNTYRIKVNTWHYSVVGETAPLPIQLRGRASGDGPRASAPATHVGDDLKEPSCSHLQLGPALATVAICRVNQQMENFCFTLSHCNSKFPINNKYLIKS